MRLHRMTAAVLCSALLAGCSDRAEDARNLDENGAPAASAPATEQPVAPEERAEPEPSREATSGTQAPAPSRTPAPRAAAPARPSNSASPAPRARAEEAPAPAPRTEPRNEARAEAPATAPARPVVRTVTVPAGTPLALELTTALSSETAQVEAPVSARVGQDVEVDGRTVIPAGSVVRGEVIDVARAGRVQGRARLGLRFTSVTIGGTPEDVRTNPVVFEGEATRGEDATKIGAGAGVGAVIGGLLGGGSGAAKGAAIGGAAGAGAVLATRGREVELPVGSNINATLASEVDLRVR